MDHTPLTPDGSGCWVLLEHLKKLQQNPNFKNLGGQEVQRTERIIRDLQVNGITAADKETATVYLRGIGVKETVAA